ncbi:MAG TPA: type II toxin-antitoxin system prevent-host-death family antitoxin [Thermoanaerobaculia bacterium]|nr:type II toxin-antitoxin system prevent-host-death family antitoxin [Thermoanaerobaculia bacterium]
MTDLTLSELEAIAGKHTMRAASEVKANWRAIVEEARDGEVIVTNSNRPEVVVMSAQRYVQLQEAARANDPLQRLREVFDRELAILRTAGAGDRMREVFAASPQDIADAANAASDDHE